MKKLTIEEKAARYDEILAKAKRYYNEYKTRDNILYVEDMEDMFSELKESENNDEKIRKELIEQVVYIVPNNDEVDSEGNVLPTYQKRIDKYLTWLEKQNIDISSFPKEQQVFMRKYVSLDKITLIKLLAERDANNAEIIESFEKQGEQKPETIFLKFRIGDKVTNGEDTYTINFIGKDRYWVKEHDCATIPFEYQHNWKLVEQNPAWSDEDENAIQVLMNIIKKSEIIDNLIYTGLLKEKLCNWLKLLKERYTWKPNDKQIEALNFVIKLLDNMFTATGYMDNYTKSRLEEILEALKKLKGE